MQRASMSEKKMKFRYVNQRLGEVSIVRMKWDRLKISSTARRAEKKFPIARWARS